MTVETDIMTVLDNYAGLTALVSTRNYIVRMPQDPTYPCTVLSYEREIENHVEGESGLTHSELQADIYAETYSAMRNIVVEFKAAMDSGSTFKSICLTDYDLPYEDTIEYYRTVLRFSVWQ